MTDREDEKVQGDERREQAGPSESTDAVDEHRDVGDREENGRPERRSLDWFPNPSETAQ